ncbi:hypothetical protein [Ekhidna sp.]|uniref:hypothetical protein n=1 Tax=Ekhidna sp. TaxID=2608089 RepID=UPI003298A1CD
MIPDSIKHINLQGQIWNSAIDESSGKLYLDVRKENEEIVMIRLDLSSLKYDKKKVKHSRWTQLLSVYEDILYFVEYKDHQDPNLQEYFSLDWMSGEVKQIETIPVKGNHVLQPSIYEHGSDYYKTVAEFLALDLPLSCEYLEWNDKIIISYYLRSGNDYERNLLLLQNANKEWKVLQDSQMKGFSPGAFFVFRDQLIFIKDRNEVCVYTG